MLDQHGFRRSQRAGLILPARFFSHKRHCAPRNFVSLFGSGGDVLPAAGSTDPFWSSVLVLLGNNQGSNGVAVNATNGADQSNYGRAVTVVGTPTWSNTTPPTGLTTTIAMAGSDALVLPDAADMAISGDYCFEIYFYPTDNTNRRLFCIGRDAAVTSRSMIASCQANGFGADYSVNIAPTTGDTFANFSGSPNPSTSTPNGWNYMSIYQSGADLYFAIGLVGGTTATPVVLTAAATATLADVAEGLGFGNGSNASGVGISGRAGPIRVTTSARGRGAAAFAVPTLPLPTATT